MADEKPKKPVPDFSDYANYPHHLEPELPKHFSMLSAQTGPEHNEENHQKIKHDLHTSGFSPIHIQGNYGYDEHSYMVPHQGTPEDKAKIENIAWKHNQHSVLHSSDLKNELKFQDSSPSWQGEGMIHGPHLKDYCTTLPSGHKVMLHLNEPAKVETPKVEAPKSEKVQEIPAPKPEKIQKSDYMSYALAHYKKKAKATPHYYGFLNGVHVFHAMHDDHDELLGHHVKDQKDLPKALEEAKNTPHKTVIVHGSVPSELREHSWAAEHPHSYDWSEGSNIEKSDDYKDMAQHWGRIHPKHKPNLHYYEGIENLSEFNKLPGHEDENCPYFKTYRKLHDQAHKETEEQVDSIYGKGNRSGKIGNGMSPNEAKRAVHWEWLTTHKQKELAEKAGHKIRDEDFARDTNTVMHDAIHRVLTGKTLEPSEKGFEPHPHLVPIDKAIAMIDDHSKHHGLHEKDKETDRNSQVQSISIKPEASLTKAFLQADGETKTDPTTHATALNSVPKELMQWGKTHLIPMKKDDIEVFQIKEKTIKVRKLMEDLYSGWIEEGGQKTHAFERVTMPELLQQLQSKLEMYGEDMEEDKLEENKKLMEVLENNKKESEALDIIDKKLKDLHSKIKNIVEKQKDEIVETISGKELSEGLDNPVKDCPACERPTEECVCYTGLPSPRVEFDMNKKKLYIFFKSEWTEEDRINFRNDIVSRAGKIIDEKRLGKVKTALGDIKKRLSNG